MQRWTVLPVAGWGLVWSLAALALPLATLVRMARGTAAEPWRAATTVTALTGLAAVLLLAGVSLAASQVCSTCAITYALVIAYAATTLPYAGRLRAAPVRRGSALAAGTAGLAFLALLYPGWRTPPSSAAAPPALPAPSTTREGGVPNPALSDLVASLSPELAQVMSDGLALYAASPGVPPRTPRVLRGDAGAPVRITEFTDVLCSHCATLHRNLEDLEKTAPAGSFAIESRQFPLDAGCNPHVPPPAERPVRCLAARVLLCVEEEPGAFGLAGALFASQANLDAEKVYELAAPLASRAALESCVESPGTQAKLAGDIGWAMELGIRGTPLVLVNGREAPNLPVLLYALVLAKGDASHPAFARLPSARPLLRLP